MRSLNNWINILVEYVKASLVRDTITSSTNLDLSGVADNESLFADGLLDSLNAIEIIETLENRFAIMFEVEDFTENNFRTIESIVVIINQVLERNTNSR